jgi:hypothetical protein
LPLTDQEKSFLKFKLTKYLVEDFLFEGFEGEAVQGFIMLEQPFDLNQTVLPHYYSGVIFLDLQIMLALLFGFAILEPFDSKIPMLVHIHLAVFGAPLLDPLYSAIALFDLVVPVDFVVVLVVEA